MAEQPAKQQGRYLSCLLCLWQESGGSQQGSAPLWRASLERTQSNVRQVFASLAALFAFLEGEPGTHSPGLTAPNPKDSEMAKRGHGEW